MATLLLDGQNAKPHALLAAGFRFEHPGLTDAFENLAKTSG
jgi:NAD dependent epimerase/dehydratase family enzyme